MASSTPSASASASATNHNPNPTKERLLIRPSNINETTTIGVLRGRTARQIDARLLLFKEFTGGRWQITECGFFTSPPGEVAGVIDWKRQLSTELAFSSEAVSVRNSIVNSNLPQGYYQVSCKLLVGQSRFNKADSKYMNDLVVVKKGELKAGRLTTAATTS